MALLPFALAVPAVMSAAQVADDPLAEPRLQVCLNGEWLRHVGADVATVPAGGWEPVRVPEDPFSAAKGSAWFRLDFVVPERFTAPDRRVLLRFVRVRHYARVLVNGRQCGENYGARAPFEVDITSAVRSGELNRLEVWVHDCSGAYAAPGKTIDDLETLKRLSTLQGYREQATIAEDVLLLSRPELHVADVLIMPSVREGKLSIRLGVTNESGRDRSVRLTNRVVLGDREVLRLPPATATVGAGGTVSLELSQPWADPRLWGYPPHGEPILYHLETKLGDDDRLVTRFGFREVWTEGDRMVLNGRDLKVLGYWVPEGSGRSVWTLRMAAIQSAGCNAIHNHAEPREPGFYDVADELGLLVWDAGYCGGPLGTTANMSDAAFPDVLPELEQQYPRWAQTVANHPSVVLLMMECLYNEEAAVRLGEAYRSVDPTRLIHRGGGMVRPMDLAAYASNFEMNEPDPLVNIRRSWETWGRSLRTFDGQPVPVVNKEIWYKVDWNHAPTAEAFAQATAEAVDYLREQGLPGFILYGQAAFRARPPHEQPIGWPSASGEGQHARETRTGGLSWFPPDFVNFFDPERPAFEPLPVAAAMREAGARYLGHDVNVAATRRPEVLVTVTRDGEPVADAYVYAVPVRGVVANPVGMRTDRQGIAWFALRDPGTYRFLCRGANRWESVTLDAPLQALDRQHGGEGPLLSCRLPV
ncbi:MAG: hypothetical protein FJX74_20280 [Armatimonadetes bacterium]|nr:hypothetical protein [Armatimonadota bacterium]